MIYLLFILLVIIFISNLYLNNKDFGAPSVIFSLSFLFSAAVGCVFQFEWGIDISFLTVIIVTLYILIFSIVCLITRRLFNNKIRTNNNLDETDKILNLNHTIIKIVLFIFMTLTLVYVNVLMNKTGTKNIFQMIGGTYSLKLETLNIPFYLRLYIAITQGVGYWISYVIVRNFSFRKFEITAFMLFVICLFSNLLSGSRGVAVCMILSFPANFLLQSSRKNKYKRRIKLKKVLITIIIGLFCLLIFVNSERWLGRATVSSWNAIDTLGTYCGAEFYNLDYFLANTKIPQSIQFGSLTFSSLRNTVSKYLISNYTKPAAYNFLYVNGYFMGNVFTMFYEPLYDFGYFGCAIIMIFYAFLTQATYNKATQSSSNYIIPFSISFYGYLFPILAVSFFAWWFGNYVVSTSFIYIVIVWKVCNYIFLKLTLTFKGRRIH